MTFYKLIHGDCLEVLPDIEDNSIDLVVTSPPYNNWRNLRTQKRREEYWKRTNIVYDSFDDHMTDEKYMEWQIRVINELIRVLKPTGTMCYNHKDRIFNFEVLSPITWIMKSNAVYRQRITWDRGGMQSHNNVRFYRVEEDIYLLGKKSTGFKWNKACAKFLSIWKIPASKNNHGVPATFPEELVNRCIDSFTDKNDVILDPFMGSGTTLKVAQDKVRSCIGIEISPNYCEKIKKRCFQRRFLDREVTYEFLHKEGSVK